MTSQSHADAMLRADQDFRSKGDHWSYHKSNSFMEPHDSSHVCSHRLKNTNARNIWLDRRRNGSNEPSSNMNSWSLESHRNQIFFLINGWGIPWSRKFQFGNHQVHCYSCPKRDVRPPVDGSNYSVVCAAGWLAVCGVNNPIPGTGQRNNWM